MKQFLQKIFNSFPKHFNRNALFHYFIISFLLFAVHNSYAQTATASTKEKEYVKPIIFKKNCTNIFSVLSSFDINIICKGYDLKTKEYLDLTTNPGKIASWNKWNPAFQNTEIWSVSRILRQLERCFKYYKRGYNTDAVIHKYIELINTLQEFQSVFSSENFNEKLKITQENTLVIKQLCQLWLTTHEITDEQLEFLLQDLEHYKTNHLTK